MAYGLGKESPVVLNLGKDNYEALISRHGQWIRWQKAVKCPCAQKDTMQTDPRCPRCHGTGLFYTYQKQLVSSQTVCAMDESGIFELAAGSENSALTEVFDFAGNKYIAEKYGSFITLHNPVQKGQYLQVVLNEETVKNLSEADCENIGGGYYRVNGLRASRHGIDGLYQTAPADIVKIGRVTDAAGVEWETGELRADMFTVKVPMTNDAAVTEPLTAHEVEYIPPFIFAMLSQELSESDDKEVKLAKGDAVCSFPYNCDVGEGDVLTVLAGSYTQKEVVNRVDSEYDVIGAYFVMDITACVGLNREYRKGIDFILAGTNRVKWLCNDAPEAGEAYSLTYHICPTYIVVKPIPQLRTSENQRLPKKVVVKLCSAYGEERGVNRNG